MKSVDVKSTIYIDFGVESNKKIIEFEVGDHVRISKFKIIFFYRLHSKVLWLQRLKLPVPLPHKLEDFHAEKIVGTFFEKEL